MANTPAKQNWIQGRVHEHNGSRDGPFSFPCGIRNCKKKEQNIREKVTCNHGDIKNERVQSALF